MTIETAYAQIERLVARFKGLSAAARKAYNEDNTRKDFILPLFHALEWDTLSSEVSAEEKVSRGWVDFAFRIDGVPRFFLETKRIAEDLTKPQWIQQAMDYAWTKGVTWALLSDFEGLRVFNAEWKEDNPLRAQFIDFSVDSYLSDVSRLWWLSRPEMAAGTLNREAEKVGKKARREPVSQHLFDDLKTWRAELFRHLHAYNPLWPAGQIDAAVLRILNRLIFIRTAEDRQVEGPRLLGLVRELQDQKRIGQLLPELQKLFREFDAAYDSQLFEKHLADELKCEAWPFKSLIEGLYGKHFLLYNFNAIDADVLGTAYEQYLGHVIAHPDAAVEVQEKRAKRKSQGIFYTPSFIVKYIVGQTLGRRLDEHGYNPSRPVRVLDMACGSGSFLIEAFEVLDRFVAARRGQLARPVAAPATDVRDHARQVELLNQCIYGVDKDEQAVAVARLNLLLKTLNTRERLPMLDNIRCGDSLLSGTPAELRAAFGDDWPALRPLNWPQEFPEVFRDGGFDVIVGNPPYVRQETLGEPFKAYVADRYALYAGTADLYVYFIERAVQLLRPGGYLGLIVANKWLRAGYGRPLRRWLKEQHIVEIVDFGDLPVFQEATTYPCILILRKQAPAPTFRVAQPKSLDFAKLDDVVQEQGYPVAQAGLDEAGWSLSPDATQAILDKMRARGAPLGEYVEGKIYYGVKTGLNEAFVVSRTVRDHLIAQDPRSAELLKPFLMGRDVKRYAPLEPARYLIFTRRGVDIDRYPAVKKHLSAYRERLTPRPGDWHGADWPGRKPGAYEWYEIQDTVDYYAEFEKPKIVYPDIAPRGYFSIDSTDTYYDCTAFIQSSGSKYLLGILNAQAITFWMRHTGAQIRGGFLRWKRQYVRAIPVPRLDLTSPSDKSCHDRLVALVDEMLTLQQRRAEAERTFDEARAGLARRIAAVDAAIDALVYELYGLTDDDIRIVEGAGKAAGHGP